MQGASQWPVHHGSPSTFSKDVLNIVETAWAACLQDTIEEPTASSSMDQLRQEQVMRLLLHTLQHTAKPARSAIQPPASPDSGIECDIPCPKTRIHLSPVAGSTPSEYMQRIPQYPATLIPKPRPLLRQRDPDISNRFEDPCTNNQYLFPSGCTQQPIAATPMQVHKRQHIPRKQDAIYNARYKTQPCLHYQKHKRCPLGENCHFAHGPEELLHPQSHPKYRTRLCMNFVYTGTCPFGKKCYFLHDTNIIPPSIVPPPSPPVSNEARAYARCVIFGT